VSGNVAMRSAVVRQMKNPMQKRTTRPTRDPIDILSLMITGIGSMKIAISVIRLRMAFDQLLTMSVRRMWTDNRRIYRCPKNLMHVPGMERSYTQGMGVHWKMTTKRYETVQPIETPINTRQALLKCGKGKMR
jgi:hypothetical protein